MLKLTADQRAAVAQRYADGEDARAIASDNRISLATVYVIARRHGVANRHFREQQEAEALERFMRGETVKSIAENFGVNANRIRALAYRKGVVDPLRQPRERAVVAKLLADGWSVAQCATITLLKRESCALAARGLGFRETRQGKARRALPRWCRTCNAIKPRSDFHPCARVSDGLAWDCKCCHSRSVHANMVRKYGLTVADYDSLLALQGGGCGICGVACATSTKRRLHVDHDHSTGAVRGLLCYLCNVMLGMSRDDAVTLRAGAAYLERAAQTRRPSRQRRCT